MFEPGHLHITRAALQASDFSYDIHIHYEVRENPELGRSMHFAMKGEVAGNAFEDEFELPRDLAFNFAHNASQIAVKHGMPAIAVLPIAMHEDYDRMFKDVRDKLNIEPGESVKPEHLV
jgi:hypothetical protein